MIENIHKHFIIYTLKIKKNTLEAGLSPIESMAMARYLISNDNLFNMEDKRLPVVDSNFSRNHIRFKWGWHKDGKSWLRKRSLCRISIILKILLYLNLRRLCGAIKI